LHRAVFARADLLTPPSGFPFSLPFPFFFFCKYANAKSITFGGKRWFAHVLLRQRRNTINLDDFLAAEAARATKRNIDVRKF
jgi:hypothetical protein